MSEEIISVLNYVGEKLGNVFPYAQEFCDKYIKYRIATSIMLCFTLIILLAISLIVAGKFHKKAKGLPIPYDIDEGVSVVAVIAWMCVLFSATAAITAVIVHTKVIITCLKFPEKILLDYLLGQV